MINQLATCDIFIRSYWRDFAWLEYCLRSINRYCSGFREVIVVIPRKSKPWLRFYPGLRSQEVRLEFCRDYEDDYLGQQVTKLYADEFTDASLICHVDSDCIFHRPTTPEDIAPGGQPRVYTMPVGELPRHWPWTGPTELFLGWAPTHDFLQCPPFTFPSWLYKEIRAFSIRDNHMELSQWILSQPPRGFSEFNVLGAYAYSKYPDHFIWIRATDIGEWERVCHWYWSWAGMDHKTRNDLELILDSQHD